MIEAEPLDNWATTPQQEEKNYLDAEMGFCILPSCYSSLAIHFALLIRRHHARAYFRRVLKASIVPLARDIYLNCEPTETQ